MTSILRLICIATLIPSAYSISCISCNTTYGDTCVGASITCPPEANSCASTYTKTTLLEYGVTVNALVRGCGYSAECAQPMRNLSNHVMLEEVFVSCCQSDDCTPSRPKGDTENSISCVSCVSTTSNTCTGPNITCSSEANSCASIYTKTKWLTYGKTTTTIVRGCGFSEECAQPMRSLSNQFMTQDTMISCCQGDGCRPSKPKVPTKPNVQNGLMCPSCFSTASKCEPNGFTQCTGTEDKCVSYSTYTVLGDQIKPVFSMTGCATANLCSNYNGNVSSSSTDKEMIIRISCTNTTDSSTSGPTTPSQSHKTTYIETNYTNKTSQGNHLSCIQCSNTNATTCDGPMTTCSPFSDSCVSTYIKTEEKGVTVNSLVRSCGYSAECANPRKSFSNAFKAEYYYTSCCQGNGCTPPQPSALPKTPTSKLNICYSCFSQTLKCESSSGFLCSREENTCVTYSLETIIGGRAKTITMSGCATENFCSNDISVSASNMRQTGVRFSCTIDPSVPNSGRKSTQSCGATRAVTVLLLNVLLLAYSQYLF